MRRKSKGKSEDELDRLDQESWELRQSGAFNLSEAFELGGYSESRIKSEAKRFAPYFFSNDLIEWLIRYGDLVSHTIQPMLGKGMLAFWIHEPRSLREAIRAAPSRSLLRRMVFFGDYEREEETQVAIWSQAAGTPDSEVICYIPETGAIYRVSNSFTQFMHRGLECVKRGIPQDWFDPTPEVRQLIKEIDGTNVLPVVEYGHTLFHLDRPQDWPEAWRAMLTETPPKGGSMPQRPVRQEPPVYIPPKRIAVDAVLDEMMSSIASESMAPPAIRQRIERVIRHLRTPEQVEKAMAKLKSRTPPDSVATVLRRVGGLAQCDEILYFGEGWDDALGWFPRRDKVVDDLIRDAVIPRVLRQFLVLGYYTGDAKGMVGVWAPGSATEEAEVLFLDLEERTLARISNSVGNFLYRGLECLKLGVQQNYFSPDDAVESLIKSVDGENVLPNTEPGVSRFSFDNTDDWPWRKMLKIKQGRSG